MDDDVAYGLGFNRQEQGTRHRHPHWNTDEGNGQPAAATTKVLGYTIVAILASPMLPSGQTEGTLGQNWCMFSLRLIFSESRYK